MPGISRKWSGGVSFAGSGGVQGQGPCWVQGQALAGLDGAQHPPLPTEKRPEVGRLDIFNGNWGRTVLFSGAFRRFKRMVRTPEDINKGQNSKTPQPFGWGVLLCVL